MNPRNNHCFALTLLVAVALSLTPAVGLTAEKEPAGETGWTFAVERNAELGTISGTGRGKRVGLFVGVSKYADPTIRNLGCSHKDAIKMEQVMKKQCGLTHTKLLLNEHATLSAVRQAVRTQLIEGTQPGDLVVIYWSGHGDRTADGSETYLVPHDGRHTSSEIRRTMLLDRTFARWMQALEGRQLVVIFDTCHSGGQVAALGGSATNPASGKNPAATEAHPFVAALERAGGRLRPAVLASATARQLAFERREQDLGVMTYYLVEALEKQSGPITLRDLARYAQQRVPRYVQKEYEGTTQTPVFSEQAGSPVILKAKK
jgi:uncharacterized caspase-like protein